MQIDVAFTPAAPPDAAVAIVIDVLRATTTITQAIDSGYEQVLACADIDQARALAGQVDGGAVLAGERQCVKPEGFDLGNSPSEFAGTPLGPTLVLTTTNGTRAIVAAADHADAIVIGSLLNLVSCAAHVARAARAAQGDVLVQCAGVRGGFTMDDAYTAGRFVAELGVWLPEHQLTDAARAAEALAGTFDSPAEGLAASKSARNLRNANLYDDVRYCARLSVLETVPRVVDVDDGVAMITA
jgi:2-phosphosulfolactate phosphatase